MRIILFLIAAFVGMVIFVAVIGPLMISSGHPSMVATAFAAPPTLLICGLALFIRAADRAWPGS